MASMYDVDPNAVIEKAAAQLKEGKLVEPPQWSQFAKTGTHKERPPVSADWWYVRAAAILRTIYMHGPIGVSKIRTKYGGSKNKGVKPSHFYKGSGSVARKVMQQLEKSELIKQTQKGVHKGRIVTPKGKSLLDKSAMDIKKAK